MPVGSVTSTVTGGGTMPLPPFAQPPANARLNKAIANRQFFIMMRISLERSLSRGESRSIVLSFALGVVIYLCAVKNRWYLAADENSRGPSTPQDDRVDLCDTCPDLRAAVRPLLVNRQVTILPIAGDFVAM